MKITLLIFFAALSYIFALKDNDSPYKLKVDRLEFNSYSTEYFDFNMTLFKLNRTVNALNATTDIVKELPSDTYVHYQVFDFRNNEYRPFAINVKKNICDFYKNEYKVFVIPDMLKAPDTNPIPAECPLKPGKYWLYNYVLEGGSFPFVPLKKVKADCQYIIGDKIHVQVILYITMDRDVIYREQFG